MAEDTKIQWCDHSASPWHGCEHARILDGSEHPGCANCYAERQSKRNPNILGHWGREGTRVKSKSFIDNLDHWNKQGAKRGIPVSVFPSLCDPFEDRPELEPWRREMFEAIDSFKWIRLILLTKRPENIRRMWPRRTDVEYIGEAGTMNEASENYRPNVWLLTSISDQQTADAMIPELLKCRDLCPVLGISAEPLLGPVDLGRLVWKGAGYSNPEFQAKAMGRRSIDWVIVGGESGINARPCNVAWIRDLVGQCREAGVPAFVKQLGSVPFDGLYEFRRFNSFQHWVDKAQSWIGGVPVVCTRICHVGRDFMRARDQSAFPVVASLIDKKIDKKGGDPSEWPADLRVREFPAT
ncbi:MAG: DUF5131 family protein [Planctomycetota bacterium]|nr:DUF5131 family protein [Planctomycetota bacterium]